MIVTDAGSRLRELDAFARKYGFSVRLGIAPGGWARPPRRNGPPGSPNCPSTTAPASDAEEIEAVYLQKGHTLDDAAGFLLELVKRTPAQEDGAPDRFCSAGLRGHSGRLLRPQPGETPSRRSGVRPRPDEAASVLLLRKPVYRTDRHTHVLPDLSRAADPHSGRAST